EPRGRSLDAPLTASLAGASVGLAASMLDVPAPELRARLDEAFAAHDLAPLPGAGELVSSLQARVPLAVATNGPAELVSAALRRRPADRAARRSAARRVPRRALSRTRAAVQTPPA